MAEIQVIESIRTVLPESLQRYAEHLQSWQLGEEWVRLVTEWLSLGKHIGFPDPLPMMRMVVLMFRMKY